MVIAFALGAVLVGLRGKLAAPFWLGIVVLPVEIVVVFATRLGGRISAGAWMTTLAVAGALLLFIAMYSERRLAKYGGAAAYLRDFG
jgi:hypothetical protein